MTHRILSRNAASSRAIPIRKMMRAVLANPAGPVVWGRNARGMQASAVLVPSVAWVAGLLWRLAGVVACLFCWLLSKLKVHKQIANRLLEPWAHMTCLVSATEWENFFALRAHGDAQPEFQELAYQMLEAYLASSPRRLAAGEWHLPFADQYIPDGLPEALLLKIVTARAARVSYLSFEGHLDHDRDYQLHDDLLRAGHFSPFEHAARAEAIPIRSGNFIGFSQYRQLLSRNVLSLTRQEMSSRLASRGKKRGP